MKKRITKYLLFIGLLVAAMWAVCHTWDAVDETTPHVVIVPTTSSYAHTTASLPSAGSCGSSSTYVPQLQRRSGVGGGHAVSTTVAASMPASVGNSASWTLHTSSSANLSSYGGGTSMSGGAQHTSASSQGGGTYMPSSSPVIAMNLRSHSPIYAVGAESIEETGNHAIMRARPGFGGEGGDVENPGIITEDPGEPIGSAILPLLLMAVAYIIIRRKKHLRHCDMRQHA